MEKDSAERIRRAVLTYVVEECGDPSRNSIVVGIADHELARHADIREVAPDTDAALTLARRTAEYLIVAGLLERTPPERVGNRVSYLPTVLGIEQARRRGLHWWQRAREDWSTERHALMVAIIASLITTLTALLIAHQLGP